MAADRFCSSTMPSTLELNAAKAFMLTTLRLWFSSRDEVFNPLTRWQDGFDAAGIDALGQHAFDALLKTMSVSATAPLQVQQPGARLLSQDEVRFLEVLNLLQNMHHDDACSLLGHWLSPPSAQAALFSAVRVADALHRAGLKIEQATHQNRILVLFDTTTRFH